jgi:hypothetical protein
MQSRGDAFERSQRNSRSKKEGGEFNNIAAYGSELPLIWRDSYWRAR